MKVVFVASHHQSSELMPFYRRIYDFLEQKNYDVTAGTLFEKDELDLAKDQEEREKWYRNSMREVQRADLLVVEISYPSTANVGHQLTYALEQGKPVIALYKSDRDPVFLRGREDEKLLIFPYTDKDLEITLADALDYAGSVQDVRFNFFISPKIGTYLDWISKNKRVPRAVYLRRLIEEDMAKNQEYKEVE